MIKLVLFDFDMTLVDSSYAIHYATNCLARELGLKEVSYEETLATIGFAIKKSWETLWGEFHPEWQNIYRTKYSPLEFEKMKLFPDSLSTIKSLKEKGIKVGIASNRHYAKRPLGTLGLDTLMEHVVGLEDVEHPKPAPDVLEKSLELFGIDKEYTVYVGDTEIDMKTAQNAYIRGIGMTTGAYGKDKLLNAGAWKVCDSLSEILRLVEEENG